jgi:prolyl-tRNA synthetase
MRYSKLFGKSTRVVSSEIRSRGHEFLIRGGFIRESSAGRFYLLPLGLRVQERICGIIDEEMSALGAQRMLAPVLHPLELWQETKRTESVSFELMRVKDRNTREFVLGGTAEEMMVALVRQFAISEKDLPFCIYQFSTKFRDELRAREFLMKDGYSFHASRDDFEQFYESVKESYFRIFQRMELDAHSVAADNGYMGGDYSHEFIVESPLGESRYLVSEDGAYSAHEDIAAFRRELMNPDEELLPSEVTAAERGISIAAGVEHYKLPAWRQIKSLVFFTEDQEGVLVSLRGDLDVSEAKLMRALGCKQLRLAHEEEVRALGSVVGFVSPLKLKLKKVGDLSLTSVRNFYTGADEWHRDTINVNYGRDFTSDILADIALAADGMASESGSKLRERRGIEVGNIFQLGTWYSEKMAGADFGGSDGLRHPYYMGCYGIGVGRTMATIAEVRSDERGLCWPANVTPFDCHLVSIGKEEEVNAQAEEIYEHLRSEGYSVLYDDRVTSAGIKLADADLIGVRKRVIVSKRLIADSLIEVTSRRDGENIKASRNELCIELERT